MWVSDFPYQPRFDEIFQRHNQESYRFQRWCSSRILCNDERPASPSPPLPPQRRLRAWCESQH
ncbi:hypothetical protein BJX99DRAFT_242622 [Aspergillus californicus]